MITKERIGHLYMTLEFFYRLEMPEAVCKAAMQKMHIKGDPQKMIYQVPVPNFSHETFDACLYDSKIIDFFINLHFDKAITKEQLRMIKIYEVTFGDGQLLNKTLAVSQDFVNIQFGNRQ